MSPAAEGDTVRVHYTGRLHDGTVFDTSEGREPFEFTIGSGLLIPGFERTVIGMEPGEKRTVTLGVADAYGERLDDNVAALERRNLPAGMAPQVGDELQLRSEEGARVPVVVTAIDADRITVDANHPLAGYALTFEIELVGPPLTPRP